MDRLDEVLDLLKKSLGAGGLSAAVLAHEPGRKARWSIPVVALSMDSCSCGSGAFLDYLGCRQNPETQDWEELYGKRMQLCLGLDIYAPGDMGGRACGMVFEELCGCLGQLPDGLQAREIRCGETSFDQVTGMFRCRAKLDCGAYLCAARQEDGEFTDFRLRGVMINGSKK